MSYKEHIEEINGVNALIMSVDNKDVNLLKSIADTLINEMENGFIFFANIKENDTVNFICKSNSSVNAGKMVKEAATMSDGNGGGSPTFAQGGGKTSKELDKIKDYIKKAIKNNE